MRSFPHSAGDYRSADTKNRRGGETPRTRGKNRNQRSVSTQEAEAVPRQEVNTGIEQDTNVGCSKAQEAVLERKEREKRRGEIGNGHHRQLTGNSDFPIGASRAEMTQPVCARISNNNFTSLLHYDVLHGAERQSIVERGCCYFQGCSGTKLALLGLKEYGLSKSQKFKARG